MSHWILCIRCGCKIVACTCEAGRDHPVFEGEARKVRARVCKSCAKKENS